MNIYVCVIETRKIKNSSTKSSSHPSFIYALNLNLKKKCKKKIKFYQEMTPKKVQVLRLKKYILKVIGKSKYSIFPTGFQVQ